MNAEALINNAQFTIFLGKNGSGKSTLLRNLDALDTIGTKYITPERGGVLKYDPSVDVNIANNPDWISNTRRRNRTDHFRQQSATQFKLLEVLVLREIEQDPIKRKDATYSFNQTLDKINSLLPKIELRRSNRGFDIFSKTGNKIQEDSISSGESELIALAIEVLVFAQESQNIKVLLLDEPDVHLHPDLQHRFVKFLETTAIEFNFKIVVATHSTAIVGAFSQSADLQISPITNKDQLDFKAFKYNPICHEILPVFGAHPLSTQFNRSPVILVEGEDDKRVIDQLVRSSQGLYIFSPCVVGNVDEMNKWEVWLNEFLPSIYEEPKAYSLRDLDNSTQVDMDDLGCVTRARLNCYSMENLILSAESLKMHNLSEEDYIKDIRAWISRKPTHPSCTGLKALSDNFDNRRTANIKDIRNVLLALLGTNKPWEVLVGQLIAQCLQTAGSSNHSIHNYLGHSITTKILTK